MAAQDLPKDLAKLPPELQVSDPETRKLWVDAYSKAVAGDYVSGERSLLRAVDLCSRKGFQGDCAVLKQLLGQWRFLHGNIEAAEQLYDAAYDAAVKAGNEVLQADLLVNRSLKYRTRNDQKAAKAEIAKAVEAAKKSKSRPVLARAYGEQANILNWIGETAEAKQSIDLAIGIDEANDYDASLNYLYRAQILRALNKDSEALQALTAARAAAKKRDNAYVFAFTSVDLAKTLSDKGEYERALKILRECELGEAEITEGTPATIQGLKQISELPFVKLLLLISEGDIYRISNRNQEAFDVYEKANQLAESSHLLIWTAGTSYEMARMAFALGKLDRAEELAQSAVKKTQDLGLSNQVRDSQSLLSSVLIQQQKYPQAISVLTSMLELAKGNNDVVATFHDETEIGRVCFLSNDLKSASVHWSKADALVPLLFDLPNLNKKLLDSILLAHYRAMLAAYIKQNRSFEALFTWTRAIAAMEDLGDEVNWSAFMKELGNAIDVVNARKAAETSYLEKKWYVALTLYQVLHFYDSRLGTKIHGERNPGGQALERIFEIPSKMAVDDDGAKQLIWALDDMGIVSPISRRLGYDALMRYYMGTSRPKLAYPYAKGIIPFLRLGTDSISEKDAEDICVIAFVALLSGEDEAAKTHAQQCSSAAGHLSHNPRIVAIAQQLQVQVSKFQDPAKVQQILKDILAKSPEDEGFQMELADTYRNEGKIKESVQIWDLWIKRHTQDGDRKRLASLNYVVGDALLTFYPSSKSVGDPLQYLKAAETDYSRLGDNRGVFEAELRIADYWIKSKNKNSALEAIARANAANQQLKDTSLDVRIGLKTAELRSAFSEFQAAVGQRSQLIEAMSNQSAEAFLLVPVLIAQGDDLSQLKKFDEAAEAYQQAVKVAEERGAAFHRRWAHQTLGLFYGSRSEYFLAALQQKEGLEIAQKGKDDIGAGWCALNLGWAYFNLGEWPEAQIAGEKALNYARLRGNDVLQFFAINLLMNVYGDRRSPSPNVQRALSLYDEAKKLAEANQDLDVNSLSDTASEVFWKAGDFEAAARSAEVASERARKDHDDYSLAHALMAWSESLAKIGDYATTEIKLRESERLLRKVGNDPYTIGRWHYTRAQLLRAQSKTQEAAMEYEKVLGYLEELKSRIRDPELLRKASSTYSFVYDELVDLYFSISLKAPDRQPLAIKALEYAEVEKGRQFLKAWGPVFARQLRLDLPTATREREQALQFALDDADTRANVAEEKGKPKEIEEARSKEQFARRELDQFANSLRSKYPAYASVKYPQPLRYSEIRREPGEALLAFRVAADKTYLWIISDEGVQFQRIERSRQWLQTEIEQIRNSFNRAQPSDSDLSKLAQIFEVIFPSGQVRSTLTKSRTITVIPDDILFLLPLEMYTGGHQQFPLLNKPIRYFPSLSSYIVAQRSRHNNSWTMELLAFGNPQFSSTTQQPDSLRGSRTKAFASRGLSLEPLPGTQKEVDEISNLFPIGKVTTFVGAAATKQRVVQTDSSRFRFVHFATHGLLPTDSNLVEPALAFSQRDASDEDIFLQMSEVLGLQLNAEIVVLSACNTGSGTVDHAEGVQNLGRAFMMAGSRSTVISLWQVADDSTALLMHEFYKNILAGKNKRDALAEARSEVFSGGYKHPFYWAPFVLMGE